MPLEPLSRHHCQSYHAQFSSAMSSSGKFWQTQAALVLWWLVCNVQRLWFGFLFRWGMTIAFEWNYHRSVNKSSMNFVYLILVSCLFCFEFWVALLFAFDRQVPASMLEDMTSFRCLWCMEIGAVSITDSIVSNLFPELLVFVESLIEMLLICFLRVMGHSWTQFGLRCRSYLKPEESRLMLSGWPILLSSRPSLE